jgi:hypothetical protein
MLDSYSEKISTNPGLKMRLVPPVLCLGSL